MAKPPFPLRAMNAAAHVLPHGRCAHDHVGPHLIVVVGKRGLKPLLPQVIVSAMRILVTAGPTREYIDTVRFISNASSGRMGCAVACAAVRAGHDVTLLLGPGVAEGLIEDLRDRCEIVPFVSVGDLKRELTALFADCDALVMTAAVGDFSPDRTLPTKLHRSAGPVTLRLFPTEDVVASVAASRREDQTVVTFAVEDGPLEQIEAKARSEMAAKGADFVVVNTPEAIDAEASDACILARRGQGLPWGRRTKRALAEQIVRLLGQGDTGEADPVERNR